MISEERKYLSHAAYNCLKSKSKFDVWSSTGQFSSDFTEESMGIRTQDLDVNWEDTLQARSDDFHAITG